MLVVYRVDNIDFRFKRIIYGFDLGKTCYGVLEDKRQVLLNDENKIWVYNTEQRTKIGYKPYIFRTSGTWSKVYEGGKVITKGQLWLMEHCRLKEDSAMTWERFFEIENNYLYGSCKTKNWYDLIDAFLCCTEEEFLGKYSKYKMLENW